MGNADPHKAVATRTDYFGAMLARLPEQNEFVSLATESFARVKTDRSTVYDVAKTLVFLGIIERKYVGRDMRWARVVTLDEAQKRWDKHVERYLAGLEPLTLGETPRQKPKAEPKEPKEPKEKFKPTVTVKLGSGPANGAAPVEVTTGTDPVAAAVDDASVKDRLLRKIVEDGPFATPLDLIRAVRRGPSDIINPHKVTHVLYDISKAGLIEFRLQKMNGSDIPINIRATERAYAQFGYPMGVGLGTASSRRPEAAQHPGDRTDFRTHAGRAEGGPVERVNVPPVPEVVPSVPYVAPEPEPVPAAVQPPQEPPTPVAEPAVPLGGKYPLLVALRGRAERASTRSRLLWQAAALAEEDEKEQFELLALETTDVKYSELEAEYLRFAADKEA